jgi:(S)-sulfolactate dehydrogenase
MLLLRGAWFATAEVLRGAWPRERLIGHEIAGRQLGLVDYGSIARVVAAKARGLDMTVAAYDPYVRKGEPAWHAIRYCQTLAQLMAAADIVSVHVPLLPATCGLIDAAALAAMKPGAILINAARGGIVDETAVVEALRAGRLAGAALDVFAEEPLTAEAASRFEQVPNLILTPHIAGRTAECAVRVSALTAANVRRALGG